MLIILFLFIAAGTSLIFVSLKTTPQRLKPTSFYTVGHRGTRGLMPENIIQATKKAIDLGCNTIEIDIHILPKMVMSSSIMTTHLILIIHFCRMVRNLL